MYPAYRAPHQHDQRVYPFLPFLAGLAVSPFLYGPRPYYGYWGPRPRPYYYPPFYGPGYWW